MDLEKELRKLYPYILSICRRRLGTREGGWHLAEDVAQETMISVVHVLPTYEERGVPLRALASIIARNKCNDVYRRRARKNEFLVGDWKTEPVEPEHGPERQLVDAEQKAEETALLEELLARLPERSAMVLRLHAQGLSGEQIGRRLGMKAGNVRVTHHRALKALRSSL